MDKGNEKGKENPPGSVLLDEDGDLTVKMPLTEKQKRAEKRKKDAERNARKLEKREKRAEKDEGGTFEGFEVVPQSAFEEADRKKAEAELTPAEKQRREMIKAGIGGIKKDSEDNDGFEVRFPIPPSLSPTLVSLSEESYVALYSSVKRKKSPSFIPNCFLKRTEFIDLFFASKLLDNSFADF